MSSRLLFVFLVIAVSFFGVKVFAHARLKPLGGLVPRSSNAGIKVGPCGGYPRTSNPVVFSPGQTITVEWEETINHPGRFEFYFSSANETNFQLLKTVIDTQDTGALPHQYSTTLTLPNASCNDCTLQMIQVMTENPQSPSLYFSCADLKLQSAGSPPTPGPSPAPSCKAD